ncbi:DUF2254 domain-containing protein [Mucilaginibacter sp. CSA2-8R]|uniref:DUF2254 domain-containing protein n=1 Tax=Mucilaginibacter sp. CSA2-8R TaxID=3141542 RepID=UPI00315D72EA
MTKIIKWLRKHYSKIISSIAFYPAIIAVSFLLISIIMLKIDFSEAGKSFKQQLSWLSLKDASTARSILTTIAGGIISLTVFSFSMVMIILNQAASQMSNRILNSMIENRFQQIILGTYIGTIVYALFLLSTIRDISTGIYVPAISIYTLILLTIVDIFLFIYFLDYVTQTVKFETVIKRIQTQTLKAMEQQFCTDTPATFELAQLFIKLPADESGYFQGFDQPRLLDLLTAHQLEIVFLHAKGTYLIKGAALAQVYGTTAIPEKLSKELYLCIDFYSGQPIERNPEYGFRQLSEVAIKALSPGINDPATAVLSIHALTDLFAYRLNHCLPRLINDDQGKRRISQKIAEFDALFEDCIFPIWQYGKDDRYIHQGLQQMLEQLRCVPGRHQQADVFQALERRMQTGPKASGGT